MTVRVPVRVPTTVGVNVTLTVQFAPAASAEPTHVSEATAKSPVMPSVIVAGVVPLFVTVTACVAEVVVNGRAANVSPVAASGDDVMTGVVAARRPTVWSEKVACSMFHRVSVPSTPVVSVTVVEPLAFFTIVYASRGPANTAVSMAPADAGLTMSRTSARFPGFTSPANTACCRVIPAVPGPKSPLVGLPSIRSVRPISVPAALLT